MDPMRSLDNPGIPTTKVDSDVTFTGKSHELPRLWLHLDMKAMLDATLVTDNRKAAYVASLFRESALDWLARQYQLQPDRLTDYEGFKRLFNQAWGYSEDTLKLMNERDLILRQATAGKIQDFTAWFEVLAAVLQLGTVTKQPLYSSKLPKELQDRGLIGEEASIYEDITSAAKRIDEGLRAIGATVAPAGDRQLIKTERVNMISVRGVQPYTSPVDRTMKITTGKRVYRAVLDFGSAVNCVKKAPDDEDAMVQNSNIVLTGPTAEVLVETPRYFTTTVDDLPHTLSRSSWGIASWVAREIQDGGRLRPLPRLEGEALDEFLAEALENNWIRPNQAQEAANAVYVRKKKGKLRTWVCHIGTSRFWMEGTLLSTDFVFGPGTNTSQPSKPTKACSKWLVVPFGVANGPSFQQRWMDFVLRNCDSFWACYIDDVIIWANSPEELTDKETEVQVAIRDISRAQVTTPFVADSQHLQSSPTTGDMLTKTSSSGFVKVAGVPLNK
ncbi:hypothetical protein AYL99_11873 [Fonsecaea erecta]|uniref:Reverse transcriptase domain-containing protein n=1 Tax=Fonsecaea erecta TaxID=1367422 RepID=A0A178Z2W4_9EURO|nr:hypothetical protein AYL99_11873 [Fonsecaea erecta]OAP53851.1 hypothetical protein AYL99_11873 [Fonsecaea erecta]